MVPVELKILNMTDDTQQEAADLLLPEYVFSEPEVTVIMAFTEDGVPAGAMAFAPVSGKVRSKKLKPMDDEEYTEAIEERLEKYTSKDLLRIHWIEVSPDYRRHGIGVVMIDALTTVLAEAEDRAGLTMWYDDEDAGYGLSDFLDAIRLFEITDDTVGGRPVHIALWTGETFVDSEL